MAKRMKPEARKEAILDAALSAAEQDHYLNLTRDSVARAASVSEATVSSYFGTMNQLRRAIIRRAISINCSRVIAQGMSAGDSRALNVPDEIKQEAIRSLVA